MQNSSFSDISTFFGWNLVFFCQFNFAWRRFLIKISKYRDVYFYNSPYFFFIRRLHFPSTIINWNYFENIATVTYIVRSNTNTLDLPRTLLWCYLFTNMPRTLLWCYLLTNMPRTLLWCYLLTNMPRTLLWCYLLTNMPRTLLWCYLLTNVSPSHCLLQVRVSVKGGRLITSSISSSTPKQTTSSGYFFRRNESVCWWAGDRRAERVLLGTWLSQSIDK